MHNSSYCVLDLLCVNNDLPKFQVRATECSIEKMTYLTRIIYSAESSGGKWGENEIDYILFLKSNITLKPNWNEVKSLKYISRHELDQFVAKAKEDGSGVTPWFDLIASSLLPKWWDKLDSLDDFKNHTEIYRFIWKINNMMFCSYNYY